MRRIVVIIIALLTIFSLNIDFVSAGTGDETKETEKKEETIDPDDPALLPLPFSPSRTETKEIIGELKSEEMGKVEVGLEEQKGKWKQDIPIFDLATAGMKFAITAIFFIAGPLVLIMLVYSGIKLVAMPENEEEQTRTKRTLIYSAIGLMVMAFSYAIVQNVIKIF